MTDEARPLALLAGALDEAGRLIAGTKPEQAELPTPCRRWTVRQVAGHVVTDLANFATSARGGKPDWSRGPEPLTTDWGAAFAQRRSELDDAWSGADLAAPVPAMTGGDAPLLSRADQQIAELAVHGWDIARATGQVSQLDSAVAEYGLRWARANLRPEHRGSEEQDTGFGLEVPVGDDAPALDRLAGWFGRDPSAMPGAQ